MAKIDRKKAFTVPQSVFKYPEDVVHCRDLSHDDKITVLRNWKQELVQLQKAGEENMLDERGSGDVGSRLEAVSKAMTVLEEQARP